MQELVKEYNSLIAVYFPNDETWRPVHEFPSFEIAIAALSELKGEIFKPPSQKELTPINKNGNCNHIQLVDTCCTRTEAMEKGYTLYWNGKACDHGHMSVRYTKSGHCKKCYQLFRSESIQQADISKDPLPGKKKKRKKDKERTTLATYERTDK